MFSQFRAKKAVEYMNRRPWSKSCLPVVLGWMANSSSASMVVTRTLTGFGISAVLDYFFSCAHVTSPERKLS